MTKFEKVEAEIQQLLLTAPMYRHVDETTQRIIEICESDGDTIESVATRTIDFIG